MERWFFSSFSKASFSPYTLNSIPPDFSQLWLQQSSHLLNSSPPLNFPFLWTQIKFTIPFPKTVLRTFISFNLWTFLCFHWRTESSLHCTHCTPFPLILQPLKPSTAPTFYRHYRDKSAMSCQLPNPGSAVWSSSLEFCAGDTSWIRHLNPLLKVCQVLVVLSSLFPQQTYIEHLSSTVLGMRR